MMEEWKEYKLGDLIVLSSGGTPNKSNGSYWNGDIPWISAKAMYDDYLYSSDITITREGLDNGSKLAPVNSILLLTRGSGLFNRIPVCLVKSEMAFNQDVKCIESKDKNVVSNFFLFYWLIGNKRAISNILETTGIGAGKIDTERLKNLPINLPPIQRQQVLIKFAESLMLKIEVNRRINENLEQQAQALFKSWFVDFEPFKDGEFVESELGMIPKGWRVAKIKDIPHTLNTGKRPKGGAITSGVPSIGAEQLKGLCNYDYTKTKYISKEYSQSIPKGKVIGYEVYLNRVGGKPGDYIQNTTMFGEGYPYENCYINDHVFKLDFMQNHGYNVYIYFTFLSSRIQKYLNACGGKAAIPVINKQNIDDIYVFLPENEYIKKFGEYALPMINMIFKNGLESARLATLRDNLLPKLMSGELKVGEIKE